MFRRQITIALACAGLICASTASNTQNTTAKQPVLVARSAPGGSATGPARGGNQGKPGTGKQITPKGGKPVVSA